MIWRVNFELLGEHVHCVVFCKTTGTFAKCGDVVVRRGEEFVSFRRAFSGAEFIGEGRHYVPVQEEQPEVNNE